MLVRGVPIVAATNTENGVIYVVNKVLTEETSSGSVLEEIQLRPELSTFYNYLQRTPLISKLQGEHITLPFHDFSFFFLSDFLLCLSNFFSLSLSFFSSYFFVKESLLPQAISVIEDVSEK